MIRLNIKLHKDSLAAYEELETNMKQEREKQLGAINYVSGFWEGRVAKTFQTCYTTMLTEGSYQEVLEQVTGMRTIMEDILPSLKALKWKCDHFDACLSGGLSTTGFFEQRQETMLLSDVLMLEESVIPRIDSYSDGIMSDINQLESALQDVMQACGGLVSFGDEPSSLKTACNKVRRIQILRNEIDDYAKKVIDLDSDLEVSYKAWENAENIDEIEQMKALTEEEKAAVSQLNIFLTVLSWQYDEQEYENIVELLQTDENGTYEFEKLLQKEELTEDEIEALAHLYEEAYEQIERAEDCQLSVDIVQCYTEKLFYFEEDTKGINQYYVSTKDSLLQSILDKIDTGNEAAIYSLENLKETKLEVKKSWFESSWKEFGSSVTELKDFKDSTDMIDVALVKTALGIQTVLYAYPTAGKREEHADEGYKVIYEKELYELPLLDRCARSGYIMTREEEKQVEKEIKAYFSIDENKFARDIALNFGPDMISQSTKVDFTPEEHEKFRQMYLLYRKTNDKDAFSYGFYSNFLLTKPFTYGGIVDRLMGYPENGSHEREYLELAVEQNRVSYMVGSIGGGGASYATGSAAMKKVPGVGKLLTRAGEKLSKVPIIGKFGAESLTNILADTTLDTAIDTIPSMVELAMDGGSAGEVALEGLKRTGISLGANGAFESVFKVGKGVLGGTGEGVNECLGSMTRNELTSYHYGNTNKITEAFFDVSNANTIIKTDSAGVTWYYKELENEFERRILSANLINYIDDVPLGYRGDLRVPDYTKIKGIQVSDTGQVRLIEAWRPGTDGAVDGTRKMVTVSSVNNDGTKVLLDRIGGEGGNYFSPLQADSTPYGLRERAIGDYLPESQIDINDSYHLYEMQQDFTRENFENAIKNCGEFTQNEKELLYKKLNSYYNDASRATNTIGHNGEAYEGIMDGVKSGTIDKMFEANDGGAIQYITPFDAETLVKLKLIERIK